ncbi:hypothetical protein BBJ28_00017798 [Nothophytophthora sp. Chile5]|nr:hypothetical protein BBJ28_00017798 [Nothophytophthora sp. Chile5]
MTHPTFPLYGYERFFAMDRGTSAKIAHVASLRGDIPTLLQHLPEAVLRTFNRHPKMRAVLLAGAIPQKVMICPPLADVSELKTLFQVHECSPDEQERAEQERVDAALEQSPSSSSSPPIPQQKWMDFVQNECEKPLDREKDLPFYLSLRVDTSTNTFARLVLFADHYMSDATSGILILREILDIAARLSSSASPAAAVESLPLRESLYESTHYVNSWMNLVHGAVSKYVMQPLVNFDTSAFLPLLPIQAATQQDFSNSPPNPRNPSFALFAQGSEANMRSAMARCEAEGVSLQGALIAASTLAFGLTRHNGKLSECAEPLQLRMDVVADMRKRLMPNGDDEPLIGLYSTPGNLVFTSSEGVDAHALSFWDVARKADHEWECVLLSHEFKMHSVFVNETLNAEQGDASGLRVANCVLSDTAIACLDYSDSTPQPFPSELKVGSGLNIVHVEDLHVYNSQPSLSSTSKLFVTALSHFNYSLMHKLEPEVAQQLFGWLVRCTERIGEFRQQDSLAQAGDRLATAAATVVPEDGASIATSEIAIQIAAADVAVNTEGADSGEDGSFQQDVEC